MSIGTHADYGREKGNDARRRPLYAGENPPGPHADGLVNLMRENHWSANPAAGHGRDLNSLIHRTAADTGKLSAAAAPAGRAAPIERWTPPSAEPPISSKEWNTSSVNRKKAVQLKHGTR